MKLPPDRNDAVDHASLIVADEQADISQFAEQYASFNRIINNLQRKYIELKEEFSAQNEQLIELNRQLVEMSTRNLAATEFLDGLLHSISAGVVAVDQEGVITHFNPGASLLLGIPVSEPTGRLYRDIIPPGDPIEANALRTAQTGRVVEAVEKTIRLADGAALVVSVSTALTKDREGRSGGAVEVFHDLTRVKRMEQEIARLNTLAALGEMAAAVAHQVRNPLSGILGYGSLLKRDLDADDPRQKLVSRITDGVEALNNTVSTLLDYTRNDEINRERIRLDELLADGVRQFRRDHGDLAARMELTIDLVGSVGGRPTELWLDPVLFRQVFVNMLCNSCQACRAQGRVEITGRILPRLTAIERYAERLLLGLDETVYELAITDTGPGIPEAVVDQIFAPFFTTRDGGTGLGLAIAWKIMKAHGGDIVVDREYQDGARLALLFPIRIVPHDEIEGSIVSSLEAKR